MDIERALASVGGYRRYHLALFSLISLGLCMSISWHGLSIVFIGWTPPHHCRLAENQLLNESIPLAMNYHGEMAPSMCEMYVNGSTNGSTQTCPNGWTYESEYVTLLSEWDLVCDRNYMVELSQTISGVGGFVGQMIIALILDRLGRKKAYIVSFVMIAGFGLGSGLAPNYITYVVLQTLTSMSVAMCNISGFLLMMEIFDATKRTEVGIGMEAFWVIDYTLLPLIAFLFYNWRHMQIFISLFMLVWLIYIWILPESPMWLVANKRYEEAEKVLRFLAKRNGVHIEGRILQPKATEDEDEGQKVDGWKARNMIEGAENPKLTDGGLHKSPSSRVERDPEGPGDPMMEADAEESKETRRKLEAHQLKVSDLFTDPKLRRHILISMLLWFANVLIYYGVILITPILAGNRFVNFVFSAIIEIPAYIVSYAICKKVGRRVPTCVAHVLAGLSLLVTALIPPKTAAGVDLGPLKVTMALLGKFFISISFAIILLYTKEIFPTNVRGAAGGLNSVLSLIGSMIAPFAIYSAKTLYWLPFVLMGLVSVVAGLCVLILPETRDCPLPQDLADVYDMYTPASKRRRQGAGDKMASC